MDAGIHSHRDAKHDREQGCCKCELEGRWRAIGNDRRDRLLHLIGRTEVEIHRFPDEGSELLDDRVIKPKLGPQLHALFVGRVLTDQLADRIADEPEQHERQQRHRQHDECSFDQSSDGKSQHGEQLLPKNVTASGPPTAINPGASRPTDLWPANTFDDEVAR